MWVYIHSGVGIYAFATNAFFENEYIPTHTYNKPSQTNYLYPKVACLRRQIFGQRRHGGMHCVIPRSDILKTKYQDESHTGIPEIFEVQNVYNVESPHLGPIISLLSTV